jgi:ribosomal protein L28
MIPTEDKFMSRVCSVCGKGLMTGHKVSHSNIKTNRTWGANVQKVKTTAENGATKYEYVCTRCLRTRKKTA